VDLVAAVVADEEPFELVEPGEGAFDDPAVAAESGAVPAAASGDLRCDPAAAQLSPVGVVVVAAVGADPVRPSPRTADQAAHRRHTLEERDQLGDVVTVAAGDRPGKRDPGRVDQEMVF
jgi:hypothetical protein